MTNEQSGSSRGEGSSREGREREGARVHELARVDGGTDLGALGRWVGLTSGYDLAHDGPMTTHDYFNKISAATTEADRLEAAAKVARLMGDKWTALRLASQAEEASMLADALIGEAVADGITINALIAVGVDITGV